MSHPITTAAAAVVKALYETQGLVRTKIKTDWGESRIDRHETSFVVFEDVLGDQHVAMISATSASMSSDTYGNMFLALDGGIPTETSNKIVYQCGASSSIADIVKKTNQAYAGNGRIVHQFNVN